MGNTRNTGYLQNAIKVSDAGAITFVSGSTTLATLNTSGQISGSAPVLFASTASFVANAQTASFVALAQSASNAVSAATASFANAFTVASTLTAQTLVVQTITSSVDFVTGSTRFGSSLSTSTHQFTGSVSMTGSLAVVTNGTEFQVTSTGVNLGNTLTDSHVISGSLRVNPNGLFVSSSGNVGIGTTTTSGKLDVQAPGTSAFSYYFRNSNGGYGGGIYNTGANHAQLYLATSAGTENILLNSTGSSFFNGGNVGINTDSPDMLLTVDGKTGGASTINLARFYTSKGQSDAAYLQVQGVRHPTLSVQRIALDALNGGGSNVALILQQGGGKVGINMTDPQSPLHIISALGSNVISIGESGTNTRFAIGQEASYTGNYINSQNIDLKLQAYLSGGSGGNIIFQTGASGAGSITERMRVTTDGPVRLGSTTNYVAVGNDGGGVYQETIGSEDARRAIRIQVGNSNSSQYSSVSIDGANQLVRLSTSNTEKLRITSGGALQMSNNSTTFSIGSIAGVQRIQYGTGGYTTEFAFLQTNDGYTPIGASAFNTRSDYRLKEDLKEFDGLSLITNMKVYDFKWKEKEERNYGFMAHELQEVVPYVVTGTKDGMFEDEPQYQGMDISKLVPVLVKAIQEQQAQINELKAQNNG